MRNKKSYNREEVFTRDKKPGSGKYKGPDRLAKRLKLTEKEKVFCDRYLDNGKNAGEAFKVAKMTQNGLSYKDATLMAEAIKTTPSDRANGHLYKQKDKIKEYLETKMLDTVEECLDIQMDMIRDEEISAAVRTTNIIDRLNRMCIGKQKEEDTSITGVGEVTITIKHKKIEPIEVVDGEVVEEVLDSNDDNGTISTELGTDGETRGSME